jgi:molybdopterin converting factor small subunit
MQITIRLLASYRQYLPTEHDAQAGYAHEAAPGATVDAVLSALPIPPSEVHTFFVNGRHAERDQLLQDGDILSVFPTAGGG